MSGIELSEATCLGYIQRFYDALEPWEAAAREHLLICPVLHADETGLSSTLYIMRGSKARIAVV